MIEKNELAKLDGRKLLPGMSSEAMIRTGARTVLSYLAEPITQNFRRAIAGEIAATRSTASVGHKAGAASTPCFRSRRRS